MGQSYRIRTELGVNKTITVQLDQEFEFLEILSLKLQQEDIYTRSCSNYGVIVGRVTANNGLGLPNARVSIFIPVENVDQSNPVISSIYPYLSPSDKNEDGYRYNLLPYEKSYSKHAATGTLPSRNDVLTNNTAVEIYDKYYKFTAKTNESGDYMIMGVPLGEQQVVMDVDLSDIGEFSLTPQDLIRIGRANETQVAGNTFRTSNDLNSLPQIVNIVKTIEISPLWGEAAICDVSINRVDFDLRDDANIDIQPTSVFLGSLISTSDQYRLRKNCKPRDNMGNLCGLESGPGQILAVRQTIQQDNNGYPILEQYTLEQNGNVIDGDGSWLVELPMNLDYLVTNEFGEKVFSNDPAIGIPTKSKYRFKIKWQQPNNLTQQTRRAYFLVPNVKEYGWNTGFDPNYMDANTLIEQQMIAQQRGSYYFGLDWSGYTNIQSAIDCEDTFYEFQYNRVYTVSGLIDQYKKGTSRGRFIGIKEVDDNDCESTVNKFPVNDGVRNFDLIFFIFSLLLQLLQPSFLIILITAHFFLGLYSIVISFICLLCGIKIPIINVRPFGFICNLLGIRCQKINFSFRFPMITYPDCQACDCKDTQISTENVQGGATGVLSYLSFPESYFEGYQNYFSGLTETDDINVYSLIYAQATGGNADNVTSGISYKIPKSTVTRQNSDDNRVFTWSSDLPIGERINIFNSRDSYFDGINIMQVTFAKESNIGNFHLDNTITVLTNIFYESGTLLTAVNPSTSTDTNFNYSAVTNNGPIFGIDGIVQSAATTVSVDYAISQTTQATTNYFLPSGTSVTRQIYPMDREYYQVVTAITVSDFVQNWNTSSIQTFPNILNSTTTIERRRHRNFPGLGYDSQGSITIKAKDVFTNFDQQYVLILQRGVDPYSPKYVNEYKLGKIFGSNVNDSNFVLTASTRLNIPIQKRNPNAFAVQPMNQTESFYPSYFFEPGLGFSAFTSSTVGYYSRIDNSFSVSLLNGATMNGVKGIRSASGNRFWSSSPNPGKYDNSEDLSGNAFLRLEYASVVAYTTYDRYRYNYFTPSIYPSLVNNPLYINNKTRNVIRTDRLPSSDVLDGGSWESNPAFLQQNNNFQFYIIPEPGEETLQTRYGSGAQQVSPDIEDLPYAGKVIASFGCEGMVGLNCYSGNSQSFGIIDGCEATDYVERGCYVFLKRPILDLFSDITHLSEWGYRFRFFYGLCRGVLSQTFVNNWINGTLYTFPIQVDTYFDKQNKPSRTLFCRDLIYFDVDTNNFYYRSSPYNSNIKKFIGKIATEDNVNQRNLLFPTTIMNLGMKDSFYSEIILDPETNAYVMDQLNPTSYGDPSDLVNLFVISRIIDEGFLQRLLSIGNNSLDQLFSRPERRIDGDLAQLLSINSEEGVIKFSAEFYESNGGSNDPIVIFGPANKPTIGVYYSSTTENLQFKDYLTPGKIDFRPQNLLTAIQYFYGIKSQEVPFYQWKLDNNSNTIFGNENNNWATNYSSNVNTSGIFSKKYQSNDRTNKIMPSYFIGSNSNVSDTFARGYIFNVSANTITGDFVYSLNGGNYPNKFLVGAPFHFYFGLNKGNSSLDKFKTKYSINE